ncbi:MAG: glycosyltransferase family 2 protein [Paludibacteraceae bacterium]|nr:glycosyltransferase family 2 protein [Paludibacteraceae bacterium]
MSVSPLISVLIANYNNGCYITQTLDSVMLQTYTNTEIIILDDCSTDNSLQIITHYQQQHPQLSLHLYQNNTNRGVGYTKQRLIELAQGDYFIFVDPDDTITPDCLQTLLNAHLQAEYSITYATHWLCDEQLKPLRVSDWAGEIPAGQTHFTSDGGHISAPALCKQAIYNQTDGINPNLPVAEDQDLYVKMEEIAPVLFVNQPLYYYRGHNHNMSRNDAHRLLNLQAQHQYVEDNFSRRKKQHPEVPNLTVRQLKQHRLNHYLALSAYFHSQQQYMQAIRQYLHACRYIFFDHKFRLLKTLINHAH